MPRRNRLLLPLLAFALLAAAGCGGGEEEESGGQPGDAAPTISATAPADVAPTQPADCPPASGDAPEAQVKTYASAPEMTIDPAKKYTATVKTVRGDFTIELRPDLAPQHVNSFVFLARDGYYDGVTFHRVVPGFVAQAGDPTGTGSGGPGYTLPLEPSDVPFERGVVGAARTSDPNSAGSQWFVTYGQAEHLTGQYTVFGFVTSGMDVVDCIQQGDKIKTIEISEG
jgi:peptidylprolyl isomerase